jgi:hypothetical protein
MFKPIVRFAMSVPVLPSAGWPLKNRCNPASKLCSPADVAYNTIDWFHPWLIRLPGGGQSAIVRDKTGRVSGSINRLP